MAGTNYLLYNPVLDAPDYPTTFTNFFTILTSDVNTVETLAAANAAYISAIPTTGFQLNDGVPLELGTSSDTSLLHTGADTYIAHAGTGDLILANSLNSITIGDTYVNLLDNITLNFGTTLQGTIRYDLTNTELDITSTKIHLTGTTTITGAAVITGTTVANGTVNVNGNIELRNNDHLYLGDIGKIDIYTSGSASYFSAGAGGLIISNTISSALITIRTDNSSGTIRDGIIIGGATPIVRLNYEGATKLSTSASGITVTGGVTTDSINATGVLNITSSGGTNVDSIPVNKDVSAPISFPTGAGNITTLYTGIPTWARRVTIFINDLQFLLGLDSAFIRLGPVSGTVSTGYNSIASSIVGLNSTLISNKATAYLIMLSGVSQTPEGYAGVITLDLINETANTWMYTYMGNTINTQNDQHFASGKISLTGNLERFSINLLDSPVNSRFTAGSFSVLIE